MLLHYYTIRLLLCELPACVLLYFFFFAAHTVYHLDGTARLLGLQAK